MEAEGNRVVSIPKEVLTPEIQAKRVKLRSEPLQLTGIELDRMVKENDFFERYRNPKGGFPNDFVDNGDGTVTDRATGLMWQKEGSPSLIEANRVKGFIRGLNKRKFAGYDNWRTPTLAELWSLMESDLSKKGLYLSELFREKQNICWSADWFDFTSFATRHYAIEFNTGTLYEPNSMILNRGFSSKQLEMQSSSRPGKTQAPNGQSCEPSVSLR
jgi:hypothetical protein